MAVIASLCLAACGDSGEKATAGAGVAACAKGATVRPFAELRFRVESTPGAPGSFAEAMDGVCRRLSKLGYESFRVRQDRHELVVRAPRRLLDEVATVLRPGRVAFFDWEPNVLGGRGPDSPFAGPTGLFQAVQTASRLGPSAEPTDVSPAAPLTPEEADRRNDTFGELHYLFGPDRRPLAGPARAPGSLATARARAPAGSRVLKVPRGVAVVAAQRSSKGPAGWFVIEDDLELSGGDLAEPLAAADARTRKPAVVLDFTEPGRAAFAALTRRVAQRGAASTVAGAPPTVAIALDGHVMARVGVDPNANPNGLDGRAGVQISDVPSRRLARRIALLLRETPLPANLVPLSVEAY